MSGSLFAALRRFLVLPVSILFLLPLAAFASGWQQPTAAELSMKSYAPDPNAPAVYLERDLEVNDPIHIHTFYARVKILSDKGKQMFGNIEIPFDASVASIRDVSGRTIESNGTVVPFTGKPYQKLIVKNGSERIMETVFSLPDVQVGSILEYRWVLSYDDKYFMPPHWIIQQDIPVVKATYRFVPTTDLNGILHSVVTTEYGHQMPTGHMLLSYILPPGDKVQQYADGSYNLTVENIPATPHDNFLPPMNSFRDRVIFYYSPFTTAAEYWKTLGKYWSDDFNHFAKPTNALRAAVAKIVSPGDSDLVKAQKIYAAVMKIDNTDYTRAHTAAENKAQGVKINNAQDVWTAQRGNSDQITRLFVAMARAAGLKAYGAIVTDRNMHLFNGNLLDWDDQLDDEIAIVNVGGKLMALDPGERYCKFGQLQWTHTFTDGVRQTPNGIGFFTTPNTPYTDNDVTRSTQLTLNANGTVQGLIFETLTGVQALAWRQAALTGDIDSVKKQFEKKLQSSMPPGVIVKVNHFSGLTDPTVPLTAVVNVSGTLGTRTGNFVFLPAVFFEAGNPPLFSETHRLNPVDMNYPYTVHDQFQVTLPAGLTITSLPKNSELAFSPHAAYGVKFVKQGNIFAYGRVLRVGTIFYPVTDYPALRKFFQQVSAADQQQVALKASTAGGK